MLSVAVEYFWPFNKIFITDRVYVTYCDRISKNISWPLWKSIMQGK